MTYHMPKHTLLKTCLPEGAIDKIFEYHGEGEDDDDDEEWEQVYGTFNIRGRTHYITYGGGPEGGYALNRHGVFYSWGREWFEECRYQTLCTCSLVVNLRIEKQRRMA